MIYAELFADLIASQVGCSIYVNGGNGEDLLQMTDSQRAAFLDKREIADSGHTKAQNKARCEALFLKLKAQGFKVIRAFDCSGLIYWALKQLFPSQKDKRARDFSTCAIRLQTEPECVCPICNVATWYSNTTAKRLPMLEYTLGI